MREQGWGKHLRTCTRSSTAPGVALRVPILKCQLKAAVPVHKGTLRDSRGCLSPTFSTHISPLQWHPLGPVPPVEPSQVGKEGNKDEVVSFLQYIKHRALYPGMRAILAISSLQTCSQDAVSEPNLSSPCPLLPVSPSASSSSNSSTQCLLGAECTCSTGINRSIDKHSTLIPLPPPTLNWIS